METHTQPEGLLWILMDIISIQSFFNASFIFVRTTCFTTEMQLDTEFVMTGCIITTIYSYLR